MNSLKWIVALAVVTVILVVSYLYFVGVPVRTSSRGNAQFQDQPQARSKIRDKDVPEGFQQLLPRGGIPAIDNPQYVMADKASISDDAYVFGVVIEGQAVAYSLNLLNGHEIVNDTIGSTNFAAVW